MKVCSFFIVPRNGQALLGMPDIKTLGILTSNNNTIGTKEVDGTDKSKTNTDNTQEQQVNITKET